MSVRKETIHAWMLRKDEQDVAFKYLAYESQGPDGRQTGGREHKAAGASAGACSALHWLQSYRGSPDRAPHTVSCVLLQVLVPWFRARVLHNSVLPANHSQGDLGASSLNGAFPLKIPLSSTLNL